MKSAVILAAGKGERMKSSIPKVMHNIIDKPMIECIIDNLQALNLDNIITVVGYQKEMIMDYLGNKSTYAIQPEQKGTADAIKQVDQLVGKDGFTLVIYGDCPLITPRTYQLLLDAVKENPMVVLTAKLNKPNEYARIIKNANNNISQIIEYSEATKDQQVIKEVNMGIYAFDNRLLFEYIDEVDKLNSTGKYYITDLVEIFNNHGYQVKSIQIEDYNEAVGINTRAELVHATRWLNKKINNYWLDNGVTIIDSYSTVIGSDVVIGQDTTIEAGNVIVGKTEIGNDNYIGKDNHINNAKIGHNNKINQSIINASSLDNNNDIGPWSNLRQDVLVGSGNRIGCNVELKKVIMHNDNHITHNVYLGDSTVMNNTNIAWGVVTANYDGKNKHKSHFGDNAFIGSATTVVSPINIGSNTVIAAGSVITEDVPDGDMGIGRARQTNKVGYGIKYLRRDE